MFKLNVAILLENISIHHFIRHAREHKSIPPPSVAASLTEASRGAAYKGGNSQDVASHYRLIDFPFSLLTRVPQLPLGLVGTFAVSFVTYHAFLIPSLAGCVLPRLLFLGRINYCCIFPSVCVIFRDFLRLL